MVLVDNKHITPKAEFLDIFYEYQYSFTYINICFLDIDALGIHLCFAVFIFCFISQASVARLTNMHFDDLIGAVTDSVLSVDLLGSVRT